MTEVRNQEEFVNALKLKDDEISISGDYCSEIGEMVKSRSTGSEYVALNAGAILYMEFASGLFAGLIESIINKVTGVPKDTAKLEKLLGLYKCTKFSSDEICLRLKQLDY